MKNKKIILLLALTAVTIVLGAIAIITSLELRKKATVPVAPTAPESKPLAADTPPFICQDSFSVAALKCYEGPCTSTPQCGAGLECLAPDATKPNDKKCVNPTCKANSSCVCTTAFTCVSKKAYENVAQGATGYPVTTEIAANSEIEPNQQIVYRVTYTNSGETTVASATITDTLPAALEYVDGDQGCQVAQETTVTCTLTNVPAGTTAHKSYRVRVKATAAAGNVVNQAVVTPAGGTASNCSIALTIAPPSNPNLSCSSKKVYQDKSTNTAGIYNYDNEIASNSNVSKGQKLVYVINYTNTGDAAVASSTITDVLSAKLKYLDGESGCTFNQTNRTVTCTVASVAAGASGQKAFRVEVVDTATAGDIVNEATFKPATGTESKCAVTVKLPADAPTPKCDDSCSSASDCPDNLTCSSGKCRNLSCTAEADCSCPADAPKCNDYCADSTECPSGLTCSANKCRNPSCTGETDCVCPVAPGATPAPTTTTTTETTTLPTAGSALPTMFFIATGGLLVLIGVLVVGL